MADPPSSPITSPPSAPSPSQDAGLVPQLPKEKVTGIPSPDTTNSDWDADSLLPETAMKMLSRGVEALARVTGDIPATPPISRTSSFLRAENVGFGGHTPGSRHHKRTLSRPGTPMSSKDINKLEFASVTVGPSEAEPDEINAGDIVAESAEVAKLQQLTIARKFFCKTPPNVGLEAYLTRLQRYCPMSTAVYLAAGSYIHKLCIEDKLVPATSRTIHRLVLASLRVAMKALEDLRYSQERFSVVGGVKQEELRALEVSLCYLTDFELQVNHDMLQLRMNGLLQAAGIDQSMDSMQLHLPVRAKPG